MKCKKRIGKGESGRILAFFPYNPAFTNKVKIIEGRRWHPEEKYWSFPDSDGTLEKILKAFEGEEIHLDPALQAQLFTPVLARHKVPTQSKSAHNFENLKRELALRKYSYKTVKGYIYYNRDLLNFTGKNPSDINGDDIKDYLLYLVEERQSATSTLNQAINALKFYYGTMLQEEVHIRGQETTKR